MQPEEEIARLERELAEAEARAEEAEEELEELEARDADLGREVEQMAEIHRALLPAQMPEVRGIRLAARHAAPHGAGGDYFDAIPLERDADLEPEAADPWLLVVADASGHGPAAAVIMAMIQAVLRGYRGEAREPARVMEFVNAQMAQKAVPGSFTTAVLGSLDPRAKTFSYAIAGHHPPLLHRRGEPARPLPAGHAGLPLGVDADSRAHGQETLQLEPGDAVLLYTDGALEAKDPRGEQFGARRLAAAFGASSGTPGERLDALVETLDAHRAGADPEDDQTLLLFVVDG